MRPLVVVLLLFGLALSVTVVPGVFTIDDNNYLINVIALRQGRLTVANTEGLSPSRELFSFDPGPWAREVKATPVASSAPPLYAVLALPFSWLGWRGLVGLNTIAYVTTVALVFAYARRYSTKASTPWLAAAAFGLGGFVIEYAQGVWPHTLSIALCAAGIFAAGRVIEDGGVPRAVASGLLLGLATGVRYQNAVIVAVIGGCLAVWSANRWRALAAFALGAAVPLSASAFINHVRLDSWNPISKGEGYLNVPVVVSTAGSLFAPVTMFWARLVDFSVRPPLVGPNFSWVDYDSLTGAHLMLGTTLQKAFLQSAPWAILALIVLVLAWVPRFRMAPHYRRQLQVLSIVSLAVLMTFAFSGVQRHEGLSFNQRYLLELLPLVAVGFAWSLDEIRMSVRPLFLGALLGVMIVLLILVGTPVRGGPESSLWLVRQLSLLKLPLLFAIGLGAMWWVARSRAGARPLLAATVGLCLGWGMTLHLGDDVMASRELRSSKRAETNVLGSVLPDHSAYVAYSGFKDAAFPLLINRDIVILDVRADEGVDAPMLIRELLGQKRRVFVLRGGFPAKVLSRVVEGLDVASVASGLDVVELRIRLSH